MSEAAPWWRHRPWRMIQTNLREIDMADIRAQRVVADLKSFGANVLMINAAGIIASYPTKLDFHFQSPYLTGDSLQQIIAACHDAEIRVIARTDFSKVRRPIHEKYPDWAYIGEGGEVVEYNGDVSVCINSGYQRECLLKILDELLPTHDFDGVFFNMAGFPRHDYSGVDHGICQCAACKRRFAESFGKDLPRTGADESVMRLYARFQRECMETQSARIREHVRSIRPGLIVHNDYANAEGMVRNEANTSLTRPLPRWNYSAGEQTRIVVTNYPKMVASITSVDFLDFPYRHVAVPAEMQRMRLAQNLAHGGGLDYYLIGRLDNHRDRSGFEAIRDMFRFHRAHERHFTDMRSVATLGLLRMPRPNEDEFRGFYRTLTEEHFLFDVLLESRIDERTLGRYEALIVPDGQCVSDAAAAMLDAWVANGGRCIFTGRPGFRDQHGSPRGSCAFRSVGWKQLPQVTEQTRSSCMEILDKSGFGRLAEVDLLCVMGPLVTGPHTEDSRAQFRWIPPHPFGPPERCYYRDVSEIPGLITRAHGRGEVAHVPWAAASLLYRHGFTNNAMMLADLVEHWARVTPVSGQNLGARIEVTLLRNEDGGFHVLHLVNHAGCDGMTFHAAPTLKDLVIRVPRSQKWRDAQALRLGRKLEMSTADSATTLVLPELGNHEAIVLTA